jgi:DnaJ family protein C protein 11
MFGSKRVIVDASYLCRLNRASQTYFFPIHLTDQLLPSAVFYATVGPLVFYLAIHRLIIRPYVHAQQEQ